MRFVGVTRQTTVATLLAAAVLSVVLFSVKYRVLALEAELTDVHRAIVAEKRAIHVLRAEWSLLNDPERLRRLATNHLGLGPVAPSQLTNLDSMAAAMERSPGVTPTGGLRR